MIWWYWSRCSAWTCMFTTYKKQKLVTSQHDWYDVLPTVTRRPLIWTCASSTYICRWHLRYRFVHVCAASQHVSTTGHISNTRNCGCTSPYYWRTSHHVLLSVSVCSNVPTYTEPICFVSEGDTSETVESCLSYLTDISEKAFRLLVHAE
jgi:hypothetical protein